MLILYTTQRCTTNNNQGGYDNNIILQALELLLGKRNFEMNCGVLVGLFIFGIVLLGIPLLFNCLT